MKEEEEEENEEGRVTDDCVADWRVGGQKGDSAGRVGGLRLAGLVLEG